MDVEADNRAQPENSPHRPWLAIAALLLIPILFFIDTALAVSRGWKMGATEIWITRTVAGISGLIILMMLLKPLRRTAARNTPQIIMLVVTLTIMLGLAEWFVRKNEFREGKPPHPHLHAVNLYREYMPSPEIMPGISGKSVFKTNSQGLRATEMPAKDKAYRILCVGGSTTECLYLDQSETWTTLLAHDLQIRSPASKPVWTAGAGFSAMDAPAHLAFLNEAAVVNEMDCVIVMVGVNDVARELYQGNPLFTGNKTRARNMARQAQEEKEQAEWEAKRPWWAGLAIFRRIQNAVLNAGKEESLMAEDVLGKRYEARRKARADAPKVDQLPNIDHALAQYTHELQSIVDTLHKRKIRLIFVTQPVLWKKEGNPPNEERLLWFGLMPGKPNPFLSTPKLREMMDQYNQALEKVAASNSIKLVDLSPMSGNLEFFIDDCHFNEAGAREVSSRLAQAIAQKGW